MMNRLVALGTCVALTAGILSGCASTTQSNTSSTTQPVTISKNKAADIAIKKYGGELINVEKETEKNRPVYEVELKNSKQGRIEVDVDRETGRIIKMEKD
ncbi:PepSY domain-containing protein [Camelliibacillus cellulosilyticus]|uniref:PepSY domain-containing protein n=1 Tax=Camelliibacillus cellulosilyticus TaxID=2174486 RepID=A0ABV9GQK4_9BACL